MGAAEYWMDLVVRYLQREGIECDRRRTATLREYLGWLREGSAGGYDLIWRMEGTGSWRIAGCVAWTGKPVIWHWIGSDVLRFSRSRILRWGRMLADRLGSLAWPRLHAADSPEVAAELEALGIKSRLVRLLPERIESDPIPLPETCTVLSYWLESRKTFYGGQTVLQLAREFPAVRFWILGAAGDTEPVPPNVTFLGWQPDLDAVYRQSSVLIRLPEHDSLSAMVLEMLARGRYVIYNRPLAGCHLAGTLDECREALAEILRAEQPNREGSAYVRRQFSVARQARRAAALCRQIVQDTAPAPAARGWFTLLFRALAAPGLAGLALARIVSLGRRRPRPSQAPSPGTS